MDKATLEMVKEAYAFCVTSRYEKKIEVLNSHRKIIEDIVSKINDIENIIEVLKWDKALNLDIKSVNDKSYHIGNLNSEEIGTLIKMLETRKIDLHNSLAYYEKDSEKLRQRIKFFESNKEAILKGEIKYE